MHHNTQYHICRLPLFARLAALLLLPLRFLSLPALGSAYDTPDTPEAHDENEPFHNLFRNYIYSELEVRGMPDGAALCVEDTVGLKSDRDHVGVIDRTFGDIDTHEPLPQRDYGENIEKHSDIPQAQFSKFMKDGIPPRGTVLVSWQTEMKTELIPESTLELLDRALYVGDVVKRNAQSPMSGTVIGTKATCTVYPVSTGIPGRYTEELNVRGVPAEELIHLHEYHEGELVVYDNWVGRLEDVYDEVAVRLSNDSVVVVENSDELESEDPLIERLSVGDVVKTKKGNLRRGRWKYGAFDPNIKPTGVVVESRVIMVDVRWLSRRFGATGGSAMEPPKTIYSDTLESPDFRVYDACPAAASTLPMAANGQGRSYHVAEVSVGDRVRFKDLAGAAVKYDGSRTLPSGLLQGQVKRMARTDTLGFDMNVYMVMQTHTKVAVLWQDLSISEHFSTDLIPDPNVEDDDEVWPGETVCTKETVSKDEDWWIRPAKVGIIQEVKPIDRIASVRWFENPDVRFLKEEGDVIGDSRTGTLSPMKEDVSLYDIHSTAALTRRRGDFVMLHPDAQDGSLGIVGPNWFGEVTELGLDGKLTVRLGAAEPIVDVQVAPEHITLVYSSDMDAHFDALYGLEDEFEDESDESEDEYEEMWVEYEGDGTADGADNDEDWSTEEEEEGDVSMPDLVLKEEVDTSKTTPMSDSDQDLKRNPQHHSTSEPASIPPIIPPSELPGSTHQTSNPPSVPLDLQNDPNAPEHFIVLDTPVPSDHHYLHQPLPTSPNFARRISKEHKILRSSLPTGIFVRTWESRLDLMRVLIIGPIDTPYEFAPFIIDLYLGGNFPSAPPFAFFHSWTGGLGPVNPNLYEDGKICLSLLGTWHADESGEGWNAGKSTILQILVSIMGLVLCREPYYNEAGYDIHRSTPETTLPSALYTERAYFRARAFIAHAVENSIEPFNGELRYLYLDKGVGSPKLLDKAIEAANGIIGRSERRDGEGVRDGLRRISLGAVVMLRRQVERLEGIKRSASP